MPKNGMVTKAMIKSHKQIDDLIIKFEKNLGHDFELVDKVFIKLKTIINHHFIIEEKAIFNFCHQNNNRYNGFPNLIKQHGIMLELINDIQNKLAIDTRINISKFKKLLINHRNIEEGILYPRLDVELDESQKKFIVKNIKEMQSLLKEQ